MSRNKTDSQPVTTLAQLRKEHKPEKAFTFTIEKDFVLIFEDYNYFEEDRQDEILDLLDVVAGNTATSYKQIVQSGDELLRIWVGDESYEKLKEKVARTDRILIAQNATRHFAKEHGADDPKGK